MIITSPNKLYKHLNFSVFLAGTIDNGNSKDWQGSLAKDLHDKYPKLDIYNPRRSSWNPNAGSVEMAEQIQWELKYLRAVNIVFFNFLEDSKSPVTMLELGVVLAERINCVIVNPRDFYRHDNVYHTALTYDRVTSSNFEHGYLKLLSKINCLYN